MNLIMDFIKYIYIAIFIIVLYTCCYFIFPTNISILQTNLSDFNFDLLLKKQPLVIEDNVKDILLLLKSWFSSNIINDIYYDDKRSWNINYHKYLYMHCLNNTEVFLYPSSNKKISNDNIDGNETIIGINIKSNQGIIIPYRWYYNIKNKNDIKLYGIHDYITYIIDYII